jgi:hypothetical protein
MSATTLLRRSATVLVATAITVPSFAAIGGSAWATQPANDGKPAATRDDAARNHGDHRGHRGHRGDRGRSDAHAAAKASAARHGRAASVSHHADAPAAATSVDTGRVRTSHADADPRGNNGTVFIHDVAVDNHPHNVPHVGCTFYVDFFGFDSSQVLSTSFVGQAPTGAGTPLPSGNWTGTMPANGASSAGRDFDAEQAFTLDVAALDTPQAQQGYHVKLTVATGEPGGVKHKVFWISGCEQPAPVAAVEQPEAPAAVAGLPAERSAPRVLGLNVTRKLPAGVTRVLAVSADRTPTSLPFTGAMVGLLLVIAAAVLAAGGGLVLAGRRTR